MNTLDNYQDNTIQQSVIFVGGLSLIASAKEVTMHFSKFGEVLKVDIPLSKSGQRKGFAFVHMATDDAVAKALSVKFHEIRGKRVAVRRGLDSVQASMETKNMQERKLFASGFPIYTTEEDVFKTITPFGRIAKILTPRGGIGKRGFCYIIMQEKQSFEHLIMIGGLHFDEKHFVSFTPASTESALKKSTLRYKKSASSSGKSYNKYQEHKNMNSHTTASYVNNINYHEPINGTYAKPNLISVEFSSKPSTTTSSHHRGLFTPTSKPNLRDCGITDISSDNYYSAHSSRMFSNPSFSEENYCESTQNCKTYGYVSYDGDIEESNIYNFNHQQPFYEDHQPSWFSSFDNENNASDFIYGSNMVLKKAHKSSVPHSTLRYYLHKPNLYHNGSY